MKDFERHQLATDLDSSMILKLHLFMGRTLAISS